MAIRGEIRHHERLLSLCHGVWRSKGWLLVFRGYIIRAILLFVPLLLHQLLQILLLHLMELQMRRNRHVLLRHERRRLFGDDLGDGKILLRIIVVAGGRGMRVIRLLGQKILVVRNRYADGRLVGVLRDGVFGRWSRHGPRWMRAMLVFGQGGFATEANRAWVSQIGCYRGRRLGQVPSFACRFLADIRSLPRVNPPMSGQT